MRFDKMRMLVAALGAAMSLGAWADLPPRVVEKGETVYMAGQGNIPGEIGGNNAKEYKGVMTACMIDMRKDSTIVVTNGPVSGNAFWPGLIITNGTVTIYMKNGASPCMSRHIIIHEPGELIISNATSMSVGDTTYNPIVDIQKDIRFIKNDKEETGYVNCHGACYYNMPSTRAPNDARNMRLYGTSEAFATWVANYFTSMGSDVTVHSSACLKSGSEILVADGRILTLDPRGPFDVSVSNLVVHFDYNMKGVLPTTNRFDCAANLNLKYATSLITNANLNCTYYNFTGAVKGPGRFDMLHDGTGSHDIRTITFSGSLSEFSGSVALDYIGSRPGNETPVRLVLENDATNATVTLGNRCALSAGTAAKRALGALGGTDLKTSCLEVAANQTFDIGTCNGGFAIAGQGADVSTVNFGAASQNAVMSRTTTATVTYGGSAALPAGTLTATTPDGATSVDVFPNVHGAVDVVAAEASLQAMGLRHVAITTPEGATVVNTASNVTLKAADGANVSVDLEDGDGSFAAAGDGTFTLIQQGWKRHITHWFDFSRLDTLKPVSYDKWQDASLMKLTCSYNSRNCPVFENCRDWRFPDRKLPTLWNGLRYITDGGHPGIGTQFPVSATNMYQNVPGLSYMTFTTENSRRLPLAVTPGTKGDGENGNGGQPIAVQCVVMVYSSRLGGGQSLVADSGSIFRRENGKDKAFMMTPTDKVELRVNGAVTEQTATPNGDWQVITLKMKDNNRMQFRGLGYYGTDKMTGNKCSEYGEVLVISNNLSDVELAQAERYLAQKWGLTYDATKAAWLAQQEAAIAATQTNTVYGVGASGAKVVADARTIKLSGNFAGEVQLTGGKLLVDETAKRPYTEAQVAAVPDRTFWVDGDDRSSVLQASDYKTVTDELDKTQIRAVKNKTDANFRVGPLMGAFSLRRPFWRHEARGFGPERGWIDFFEYTSATRANDNNGNTLRMIGPYADEWDELDRDTTVASNMTVQTILFAHDSTYGGGNPVYDSTAEAGPMFSRRDTTDPATRVWLGNCAAFREGLNRIDGVTQTNPNGFGGKPEVYTVRGTSSITTQYFIDYYAHSENKGSVNKAACVGEMLYFSSALSDEHLEGIEAYLMQKWLGTLPSGFADARQATVTGTGTVEVGELAKMPQIASSFTGSVNVGGETGTLAMTVDVANQTVSGALRNTQANFTLPAAISIQLNCVNVTKSPQTRRYTLVEANTTSTFELDSSCALPTGAELVTTTTGNTKKVELVLPARGMIMMFK